jgi:DNA-binding NtrC family response regulator
LGLLLSFSASYFRQIKVFGGFVKLPSVLVVDDDDAISTVLQDILLTAGFEVSATSSSSDALAKLKERSFGVLIYDLSVAGEQGASQFLASCMTEQPRLAILLVTGFANDETKTQAAKLGFRLLEKPFGAKDLLFELSSLIGHALDRAC